MHGGDSSTEVAVLPLPPQSSVHSGDPCLRLCAARTGGQAWGECGRPRMGRFCCAQCLSWCGCCNANSPCGFVGWDSLQGQVWPRQQQGLSAGLLG